MIIDHLQDDGGEHAAAGCAVGGVVGRGLGGRVRRNRKCLGAVVGGPKGGRLRARCLSRNARRRDEVAVDSGVKGQVIERDILRCVVIGEGGEVDGIGPHTTTVVVEAGLPTDHVLDVLDYELGRMRMGIGISKRLEEQNSTEPTVMLLAGEHGIKPSDLKLSPPQ